MVCFRKIELAVQFFFFFFLVNLVAIFTTINDYPLEKRTVETCLFPLN